MLDIHPSPLVAVLKAVLSEIVNGCFENHHNYCKDVLCRYLRIGDDMERRRRRFPGFGTFKGRAVFEIGI